MYPRFDSAASGEAANSGQEGGDEMREDSRHAALREPAGENARSGVREVSSEDLLRGAKELLIRHGDVLYRLRSTRNGKLILTK